MLPGIKPEWRRALFEPGCADIDVAALHAAYLSAFRRRRRVGSNRRAARTRDRAADALDGRACGRLTLGRGHDRQRRGCLGRSRLPTPARCRPARHRSQAQDDGPAAGRPLRASRICRSSMTRPEPSTSRGRATAPLWLSPHDEIASDPCDAAPEEIDVATAIDRFQSVVDWPVEAVERSWAGLRSFAPDRLPVYGFDSRRAGLLLVRGAGRVRDPDLARGGEDGRGAAARASSPTRWSRKSIRRSSRPRASTLRLNEMGRRGSRLPSPTIQQGNERVGDGPLLTAGYRYQK